MQGFAEGKNLHPFRRFAFENNRNDMNQANPRRLFLPRFHTIHHTKSYVDDNAITSSNPPFLISIPSASIHPTPSHPLPGFAPLLRFYLTPNAGLPTHHPGHRVTLSHRSKPRTLMIDSDVIIHSKHVAAPPPFIHISQTDSKNALRWDPLFFSFFS